MTVQTGPRIVASGSATANTSDQIISGGFNHISITNDGTTQIVFTVDEPSTGTPARPVYINGSETFSEDISGSVLHYSVASGTSTFRYVLR